MSFSGSAVGRKRSLRALLTALLLAAAAVLIAVPALARAEERLPLIDTTESLGPGVSLHHVKSLGQGGWQDEQVLTIHLGESGISTNLLTAGAVAKGGPLSELADNAGAVAAINGDFYDTGNSDAAEGGEIESGQLLKSPDIGYPAANHFGVTEAGLARLANLATEASAEIDGTAHPILSVNTANGGGGVPANGMVAYTPAWGSFSRARAFTGVAEVAEALVVGGKVASVDTNGARSGTIPAGGFALVGREASAATLRALQVGDEVSLTYGLSAAATKELRFALGADRVIVENGAAKSGLETAIAPRTAAGFKDGGHTLVLAIWNGPGGTGKAGIGINVEAADLVEEGVETAVNLDGGGSTEMVARALGAEGVSVRNEPADGDERTNPNGVGVFVEPGDGQVHHLYIAPGRNDAAAEGSARVFPGDHLSLAAAATDDHQAPVALTPGAVAWTTSAGSISTDGVLAAPANASGTIPVHATDAGVQGEAQVRVLDPLQRIELSSERLTIVEAKPQDAVGLTVTGKDDQGFRAPLEPADVNLTYDHSVIEVKPEGGAFEIVPLVLGATNLVVESGGVTADLPITVGVNVVTPYKFDDEVTTRWLNNSTTAAPTFAKTAEGLEETFPAMRNVGITAASGQAVPIPGQPLRVRVKIKSSISVPSGLTYINLTQGNGVGLGLYGTGLTASSGWQYATFSLPANTIYPVSLQSFQGINTNVAEQRAGTFVYGGVEADVPPAITLPEEGAPTPDPLIADTGSLPSGGSDFQFATISDIQFTADNPALAEVARTAIRRIRQTNPDLIVLNGDVTDRGLPQDLQLAREVLEESGCEIVPPNAPLPVDYTPTPGAAKVPCYYVPGNHESYGLNNVQETLAHFEAQFGTPYRYFDHKGTRFILLASSLGTLRGSAWQQLPMFRQALASAVSDPSVHNVMVFAHHPVDDPSSTKASQLGDREEVALIEKMLTSFREESGKPAAMVGSHAQVAYVHRIEGVPYVVLPSSGKDPYGTPDHGGFTGWNDWSIDPADGPSQQWLTADVHAFAQSITLNAPASVEVSTAATLSGSIVQPEGVGPGTRIVPLRYPMSVGWGGSANLAIGSGATAIATAQGEGKTAILDPATGTLTGLAPGTVEVSVTNDSMRPYTGAASLEPITTTKTVQVLPFAGGPVFSADTPVFPLQPVGSRSDGQTVTVTDTGNRPLTISSVGIDATDPASQGEFVLDGDACSGATVEPGASCAMVVRYAPTRANVTSTEALVFQTNTAAGEESVPLSATSTGAPIETGPSGPATPRTPTRPSVPKDASVHCSVVEGKNASGAKVTCTVSVGAKDSRADARALLRRRARLLQGGKVVARGTVAHLRAKRTLRPGVYTMVVQTGAGKVTRFKVRLH
jgi:Phosphodiester glycosidase/Calcineurin-like phosphoesterase